MRRQECPFTAHSSISPHDTTRHRTRRVAAMRLMPFSLQMAVVMVVIMSPLSLAAQPQCPEDAKVCTSNGRVLHRDPQRNCQFPDCSSGSASHGSSHVGSSVGEVVGCEEDALACPNGDIVSREPKLHCEFPACPPGGSMSAGSGVQFLQDHNFPTPSPATPEPDTPTPSVRSSASSMAAVAALAIVVAMAGVLY